MAEFDLCDILTLEEKELLRYNPEDMWIAAKIKTMDNDELWKFNHSIVPKARDMAHYHIVEEEWKRTSAWLLGINLGREPSKEEIDKDYSRRNGHRFMPFYALKYLNNVEPLQLDPSALSGYQSNVFQGWTQMF